MEPRIIQSDRESNRANPTARAVQVNGVDGDMRQLGRQVRQHLRKALHESIGAVFDQATSLVLAKRDCVGEAAESLRRAANWGDAARAEARIRRELASSESQWPGLTESVLRAARRTRRSSSSADRA